MPDETPDGVITERVVVKREFPIEELSGDGRTIHARIVPYNTPTMVKDPGVEPYMESWLPGVFHRQTRAADKIEVKYMVNVEHWKGIDNVVGHGKELDDRDDALYGTFRIHETTVGETALEMVRDNVLDGISLEALVMRSRRNQDGGVVERVRAHLDHIALCRMGAFNDAKVLAVRNGEFDDENETIDLAPKAVDLAPITSPEVDAILQAVGYQPLARTDVVRDPWDPTQERFTDETWERACLIVHGDGPAKERCKVPVLEPDGQVNVNAIERAARDLLGGKIPVTGTTKADVARKLLRLYRVAQLEVPSGLKQAASR